MRVLVCGGRDYPDRHAVWRELDRLCEADDAHPLGKVALTIIHGACRTGADRWADEWAVINWSKFEEFPADWDRYGRAAGPIRNQRMLDQGKPDLVLAFPGGAGTRDMIARALRAGVRVELYEPHRESRA